MTIDELVKDLRTAHDHADGDVQAWGDLTRRLWLSPIRGSEALYASGCRR